MGNIIHNTEIIKLKKTLNKRNKYIEKLTCENIQYKNEIKDLTKKYEDLNLSFDIQKEKYLDMKQKVNNLLKIDKQQDEIIKNLEDIN
jgi:predicted RNase H-like nuclease (RuvC/YqgF family)